MLSTCGNRLIQDIYWINSPYRGESKLAIRSEILYGNDPISNEKVYKRCSFLIYINNYDDRKNGLYQSELIPPYTIENDEDKYISGSSDEDDYDSSS